jgi:3-phosphoshikimate 1-carboxyvinyltransferase
MKAISLRLNSFNNDVKVVLPTSKSISNRLLIIQALCEEQFEINNLSNADDTVLLQELLNSKADTLDCGMGGTTMRFLLSYLALRGDTRITNGHSRLKERPIKELLLALESLGAKFHYLEKEFSLPLRIEQGISTGGAVTIDASVSSQFISSLMLIAPYLKNGLTINFTTNTVSSSYIYMTANLMKHYGVDAISNSNSIAILESKYIAKEVTVNGDWSSAAFIYGICALIPNSKIEFTNLKLDILQGDEALVDIMLNFGVSTAITQNGIQIENCLPTNEISKLDLINNPDLLPALAVLAFCKGMKIEFTGLQTLIGKESNRLAAIQTELKKLNADIQISDSTLKVNSKLEAEKLKNIVFDTYNDHRLAMAFSLFAVFNQPITINNPTVVSKSFPKYFDVLNELGFNIDKS